MRRFVALALSVAALAFAFRPYVARAEEEGVGDVAARLAALEKSVVALQKEVLWLSAREATTTRAFQGLGEASKSVAASVAEARTLGFEAAAISGTSRTAVLRAFDALTQGLSALPAGPSAQEAALKKAAEQARKDAPK